MWAHYLHQHALHDEGELHGPAEEEFRSQLGRFVAENGPIVNAYWCTGEASAVALTEQPGERVLGFLWRRRPNIRLHAATDWVTRDAPEISHALHTCETLAIRVSEVLSCTSERIAMQWLLSIAGYLLSVVDDREKKSNRHELLKASNRARAELAQVEHYYDRAGEKTGRLVYFWGMLIGVIALAVLAVPGVLTYRLFGNYSADSARTFFICYAMGAVGAIVSVMMRMASKSGVGFVDYEVGRPSLRRVGSFRPIIGAVFGVVVYFALKSDLITAEDVERPDRLLLRHVRLHRGVQRAQGDGHPGRGREDARGRDGSGRGRGTEADQPAEGSQRADSRRARLSVAVETAAPESVVPDQNVLPDEITLALGGEQTLLLPSSAGAGYVWEAAVDDEAVVEVSTKFEDAGAKGAARPKFGENELLTLRGRAEGRTAVRLVQRRTWEEGVAPIAAHALTVNVAAAEATKSGGTQ